MICKMLLFLAMKLLACSISFLTKEDKPLRIVLLYRHCSDRTYTILVRNNHIERANVVNCLSFLWRGRNRCCTKFSLHFSCDVFWRKTSCRQVFAWSSKQPRNDSVFCFADIPLPEVDGIVNKFGDLKSHLNKADCDKIYRYLCRYAYPYTGIKDDTPTGDLYLLLSTELEKELTVAAFFEVLSIFGKRGVVNKIHNKFHVTANEDEEDGSV